jgi:hypothetical protein
MCGGDGLEEGMRMATFITWCGGGGGSGGDGLVSWWATGVWNTDYPT